MSLHLCTKLSLVEHSCRGLGTFQCFNMSSIMEKQKWGAGLVEEQVGEGIPGSFSGQEGFLQPAPSATLSLKQSKDEERLNSSGVSQETPLHTNENADLSRMSQSEDTPVQLPFVTSTAHKDPLSKEDAVKVGCTFPDTGKDGTITRHTENPRRVLPSVGAFTVQCALCLKWRLIPTKEQYEEIRQCILETPFVCETACRWRSNASCSDPADLSPDMNGLWAIDKPNIPRAPPGWERLLMIRGAGSSRFADIYYIEPSGKKLRSMPEIERFLAEHPEYVRAGVKLSQFSFVSPRPLDQGYLRKTKASASLTVAANKPINKKNTNCTTSVKRCFSSSNGETQGAEKLIARRKTLAEILAEGQSERLQESHKILCVVGDQALQSNEQVNLVALDHGLTDGCDTLAAREQTSQVKEVVDLPSGSLHQTLQEPETSGCLLSTSVVQVSQGLEYAQLTGIHSDQVYKESGNYCLASSVVTEKGLQTTQHFMVENLEKSSSSQQMPAELDTMPHSIQTGFGVPIALSLGLDVGGVNHPGA